MATFRAPLTWFLAAFLLANVVAVVCLILALRKAGDRLLQLEQAVRLYEYERVPPAGYSEAFGFKALLNHLMYWAPKLPVADVARGERDVIEAKLRSIVDAMATRPDNYSLIETAYLSPGHLTGQPMVSDEIRRWLLLAACGANHEQGSALIAKTTRKQLPGTIQVSARLRQQAIKILLEGQDDDRRLAGDLLHEILTQERDGGAQFFNFVALYQGSGHPKIEHTMLMLLGRREHHRMTVQQAVDYLGRVKSKEAIEPLKRLFKTPPWRTGDNQIFRDKCLTALDGILGSEIEPFLKEMSRIETNAFVRNRIDLLRKKYSSGN